ncbi:MAG: hypothetical protein VB050_00850 [Geobacteraceae bacterium]|nr:hypothetical protein [Geobacteraceae bacterium]
MRTFGFRAFAVASAFIALIAATISPAHAAYTIIDLGAGITPNSINNVGQIAGYNGSGNLFLYDNGTVQELGTFGGALTNVYGISINNNGLIAVTANSKKGYVYDSRTGNLLDMGFTGSSMNTFSINDSGQVAGSYFNTQMRNFVYQNGVMTDIGNWGQAQAYSYPVLNNTGKIAGTAANVYGDNAKSYISDIDGKTAVSVLGDLGGSYSFVRGMNDFGDVVGQSSPISGSDHAFVYTAGSMKDLGSLGGLSIAYDINNQGQIIGFYEDANKVRHSFIYENGAMSDLTSLLTAGSGWDLSYAMALNDQGQIIGYGKLNGVTHGYLLSPVTAPVPIPAAAWLLGSGLLSLVGIRKKKSAL